MYDLLVTSVILTILLSPEPIQGSVAEMTVKLKDYHNPGDHLMSGSKCDFNVFYASDFCDPRFLIEVGSIVTGAYNISEYQTLVTKFSPQYKNAKSIHSVFFFKQSLDTFPEHLRFNITIVDVDSGNGYQKIQEFIHELEPKVDVKYVERLGRTTTVMLEVQVTCGQHHYGPRCDIVCVPTEGVWECDPVTGERKCALACENGKCEPGPSRARCVCDEGWQGPLCNMLLKMTTPIPATENVLDSLENETAIPLELPRQEEALSTLNVALISFGSLLVLILIAMIIGLSCFFSKRRAKQRRRPSTTIPAKENPQYMGAQVVFSHLMAQGNPPDWEPLPVRKAPSMAEECPWKLGYRGSPSLPADVLYRPTQDPTSCLQFNRDSDYECVKEGDDGYEPLNRVSTVEQ